ncbi:MAG: N-acetylmuramoyl-L-alanine amidase [Eubacterium sp.]|nr:N-acetylmuramoyl-L-alanine amidase [Eubacterium sp.]
MALGLFSGGLSGQPVRAANEDAAEEDTAAKSLKSIKKGSVTYIIALDPGHGGNDTGADGWNSSEKRLNLLIGTYLKAELEKYDHVKVVMTRAEDKYVGLHDRTKIARKKSADLLVSLHNDSWDPGTPYDNGCSILIAKKGSYKPDMADQELYLARSILSELEKLGLNNRGLVRKKSSRVKQYEDGSSGDYHAIIRDGMIYSIPSILIEHAFCDNKSDYRKFLKTNKQLKSLAAADARGIARYLGLKRSDTQEVLEPIEVKGKLQYRAEDPGAYYKLARKAYYISQYESMMEAGRLRHQSNLNLSEEGHPRHVGIESDEIARQQALDKEAAEKAREIKEANAASEKKLGRLYLLILAGFALLWLIREIDFGFRISFRVRRRGEKYADWKCQELQYNYCVKMIMAEGETYGTVDRAGNRQRISHKMF